MVSFALNVDIFYVDNVCIGTQVMNNKLVSYNDTINLVANTDYDISNPFDLNRVPFDVNVYDSSGTRINVNYINIDQATGDITINVGANYTNAIVSVVGW